MKSFVFILVTLFSAFSLRAQTEPSKQPAERPAPIEQNPPPLDAKNMDTSVKPQDDFYLYANGGWLKGNPVPPEYSRWGSFDELTEKNNDALHKIADKAANTHVDAKTAPEVQKVGDYYASGMDEKTIGAERIRPLEEELKRIDAIKNRADVLKAVAHLHTTGVGAFFEFGSGQDEKDSTREIAQAAQGGLGLPDRDYYIKTDEDSKKKRAAYIEHVTKMLTLLGEPASKAADDARKIMALETFLAKASRTRVELRDPQKNYNKMSQADLQKLTADWNWADYFKEINLAEPGDINVHQPEFFKAANAAFTNTSIDDWKTYLRWHLINAAAEDLSNDFVNEDFNFSGGVLRGTKKIKPRWKRVVASTDEALGEALGKLYVAEYFPPEAKARALEMINNLKAALADRIKTLDWMDEPTKQEALKKLAAMNVKIGYPDKWRDYSLLNIDRGPYVLNAMRAANFEVNRDLKKIGKPVDRTEWGMTPPTVNAYYNSNMNEIVFPAGILQPPFFDPKADDAVNYGGMGAVIGHEMTHGFDDSGSQFDGKGNLREWWTKEDRKNFDERAACVRQQFDGYEVEPGLHENGKLVLGESIADLGGLSISYAAYEKAIEGKR